ncbi:MFS transporter [Microlunatus speluncae]|uniref:MFS transporter n=1 Tax=Microlunatus speluncae TaxID=2594267 RepID=UPI0012667051|nr:MFS transporter [Microlunatus speluncae]
MTSTLTAPPDDRTARLWRRSPAVALFVGAFVVASTELMPVGLLPQIATDLGVSVALAGQLVTVNALALAVGAPLLAALLGRFDQRRILIGALIGYAAGQLLAGVAPSFPILLASRVISGATMGLYLASAVATAARLARPERQARAIATVGAGVSTASAIGVPLSSVLSHGIGWRVVLGGLAGAAVIALLLIALAIRAPVVEQGPSLRRRLAALAGREVIMALALIMIFWAASFAVFTYLMPLLQDRAGLNGAALNGLLVLSGAAAVAGTALGGRLADLRLRLALVVTAAVSTVTLILIVPGSTAVAAMILVPLWQLAAWSFVPMVQVALFRAAGPGGDLALSLAVSGFNVGIVVGAGLGGLALGQLGLTGVTLVGAALSVPALLLTLALTRRLVRTELRQDTTQF